MKKITEMDVQTEKTRGCFPKIYEFRKPEVFIGKLL